MALEDVPQADPREGRVIGPNEVICQLSKRALVALRGDQFVVLKQLDVEPAGVRDLQLHAEALSQVNHPNLARVVACDETPDGTFWVSELVGGATLQELRAACKKAGKSLSLGLIFSAIHEAALALGELHGRRRAHGDVRDSNIIVSFAGTAKVLEPGVLDSIQRLPPDPQLDTFALARLLYELLTGVIPDGPAFAPPSSFNHALEKPVDELLQRALGPDRMRRYKNGTELAQALKSAAGAYMWKVAQRADFVSGLFKERKKREQQLRAGSVARLAELRALRAAEQAAKEEAAKKAAFVAQQAVAAAAPTIQEDTLEEDEELLPPEKTIIPPEILSIPRRAMMGGFGAVIGVVACVFLVNALSGDSVPAGATAAVLAPPIPVLVAVKPPEPPPAPAEATAAATQAAPAQEAEKKAEVAASDEKSNPEAEKPKPKKARKKKPSRASDDAPLPPWLAK